jgi:hypothetical protein
MYLIELNSVILSVKDHPLFPRVTMIEPPTINIAPVLPRTVNCSGAIIVGAITDTISTEIKVTIGAVAITAPTRDTSQ